MKREWITILALVFVACAGLRMYGAFTFGFDMDGPGTFKMINFDEAGSCRAKFNAFGYPKFVGHQVVAIATLLGEGPKLDLDGKKKEAKAYCQSEALIKIQRGYSAVTGALTVVLLGLMALMMWPSRPQIAWTACAVLGLSNLHIAQSHWGTADAPSVFFVTAFTTLLTYSITTGKRGPLLLSPLLLLFAVWAKLYAFAVFGYACLLASKSARNTLQKYAHWLVGFAILAALVVAVEANSHSFARYADYLWGRERNQFGTGFGHIGTWRRWIRNAINLPVVHIVGLGLPASVFAWVGLRRALKAKQDHALWLTHGSALAFALYMLVLGPVTYYRHYLPLLPSVALLAAYGLWETRWARSPVFLAFFLIYPGLLTLDSERNYRDDPRRQLGSFLEEKDQPKALVSYYVAPPRGAKTRVFNADKYLAEDREYLRQADYLVLSENWYDTAFANELTGPFTSDPEWAIRTKPKYVMMYRHMLSEFDPNLELAAEFDMQHFMPEFLLHRRFYGTFQRFIGDVKVYRVL